MTETKNLTELHAENVEWLGKLKEYEGELDHLDQKLAEVFQKSSTPDTAMKVERFQNQFIRQRDVLDELKQITRWDDRTLDTIAHAISEPEKQSVPDHIILREKVQTFDKIYSELKEEFEKFMMQAS